jgi:hypothetical protein
MRKMVIGLALNAMLLAHGVPTVGAAGGESLSRRKTVRGNI